MDAKTAREKSIKLAAERAEAQKALEEEARLRKEAIALAGCKARLASIINNRIPEAVEHGYDSTWVFSDESDYMVSFELRALGYNISYETQKFSDDDWGTQIMVISWA